MGWKDVTLKYMLQVVYQLKQIIFQECWKNLSLLFSDLQGCDITIFL